MASPAVGPQVRCVVVTREGRDASPRIMAVAAMERKTGLPEEEALVALTAEFPGAPPCRLSLNRCLAGRTAVAGLG